MLDINLIREQPDIVRQSLTVRQLDAAPVDQVLELDKARRELIQEVEALKAERNNLSKEIARTKDAEERQSMIESSRGIGARIGVRRVIHHGLLKRHVHSFRIEMLPVG